MARIVAGNAKGRRLVVPARGTRPTSERVREALFSALEHRGYVHECAVLDVYAGSGAFALEALSRGAAYALCVDSSREAARAIRANAAICGFVVHEEIDIASADALEWAGRAPQRSFDVAFLDPPYALADGELAHVISLLPAHLAKDALIIVERDKRSAEPAWPEGAMREFERTWGDTRIWMARRGATDSAESRGA